MVEIGGAGRCVPRFSPLTRRLIRLSLLWRVSFGSEATSVWQLHEIRGRISLDVHCPVVPLEPEPVTMGSDFGSIVL